MERQLICKCGKEASPSISTGFDNVCFDCYTQRNAKIRTKLIQESLPVKYWDMETDQKELLNQSLNSSLFINGVPGCGKTVFACSVAKKYLENGTVKFISYPSFIMQLQSSFKAEKENPYEMANKVAKFEGLLIIDDMGAEKLTDFVRQITYFILNEREQWNLKTIITSNFSLSQLDEQVDSRISSRIAGMCKILKLNGRDRRLKT